jgi:hypothetical protein
VGAICSWEGNRKIGAGSATIIESKPGELVRERMDWKRPMGGTSTVEFTFKPAADKTVVTWAMYGKNGFMGKLVSLFMAVKKWSARNSSKDSPSSARSWPWLHPQSDVT